MKILNFLILVSVNSICFNLPDTLSSLALDNLQSIPQQVQSCHLVYIPEIGFVIAVTKWRNNLNDTIRISNMDHKFSANNIMYYKTTLTNGNEKLRQLYIILIHTHTTNDIIIQLLFFIVRYREVLY